MRLYHYTCVDHGQPGIEKTGKLVPRKHPLLPELGPVVWLTDLTTLEKPEHLGLTNTYLPCDRTAVRYRVNTLDAVWWPFVREQCDREVVLDLERYGRPSYWWICRHPLEVLL